MTAYIHARLEGVIRQNSTKKGDIMTTLDFVSPDDKHTYVTTIGLTASEYRKMLLAEDYEMIPVTITTSIYNDKARLSIWLEKEHENKKLSDEDMVFAD